MGKLRPRVTACGLAGPARRPSRRAVAPTRMRTVSPRIRPVAQAPHSRSPRSRSTTRACWCAAPARGRSTSPSTAAGRVVLAAARHRAEGSGVFYAWPPALRRFLDGTDLALVDHVAGTELAPRRALGLRRGRRRGEDAQGNPLGLDKSNRLCRLFASRSAEHLAPLLDAIGRSAEALEEAGVRPFLAYGTLLGAVRQGDFIGHDSDADLGYVSAHDHPVDAVLESFRLAAAAARQWASRSPATAAWRSRSSSARPTARRAGSTSSAGSCARARST